MTAPLAPDPQWQRILANDAEDEAWQELTDRNDRLREHAPAAGFKYRHTKETHDQAQDHPDHPRADRAAVAPGPRGRRDVGHRPADLAPGAPAGGPGTTADTHSSSDCAPASAPGSASSTLAASILGGEIPPEHSGTLITPHRRSDPVPPNAAPTIAVPAGEAHAPAGNQPEERTP